MRSLHFLTFLNPFMCLLHPLRNAQQIHEYLMYSCNSKNIVRNTMSHSKKDNVEDKKKCLRRSSEYTFPTKSLM